MTKDELIAELLIIVDRQKNHSDIEADHGDADSLLLKYINDRGVNEAFNMIEMWYA